MNNHNNLIKVFTGTELVVNLLKSKLEEIGITGIVKNDFQSAIIAGFGASPTSVELYIDKENLPKAEDILAEFYKNNE
jgi:hypothetical protein